MSNKLNLIVSFFVLLSLTAVFCAAGGSDPDPPSLEPGNRSEDGSQTLPGGVILNRDQVETLERIEPFFKVYSSLETFEERLAWVRAEGKSSPEIIHLLGALEVFAERKLDEMTLAEYLQLRKAQLEVYDESSVDISSPFFETRSRLQADYLERIHAHGVRSGDLALRAAAATGAVAFLKDSIRQRKAKGLLPLSQHDRTWNSGRLLFLTLMKAEEAQRALGNVEIADELLAEATEVLPPPTDLLLRADHAIIQYRAKAQQGKRREALEILENGIADVFDGGFPTKRYVNPLQTMIDLYRLAARMAASLNMPDKVDSYVGATLAWDFRKMDFDSVVDDAIEAIELNLDLDRPREAGDLLEMLRGLDLAIAEHDQERLLQLKGRIEYALFPSDGGETRAREIFNLLYSSFVRGEEWRSIAGTVAQRLYVTKDLASDVDMLLALYGRVSKDSGGELATKILWAADLVQARRSHEMLMESLQRGGIEGQTMAERGAWLVDRRGLAEAQSPLNGVEIDDYVRTVEKLKTRNEISREEAATPFTAFEVMARTPAELVGSIPSGLTVLKFRSGRDTLSVWLINAEGVRLQVRSVSSSTLRGKADAFYSELLALGDETRLRARSAELYRLLIPKAFAGALQRTKQLLIVGDETTANIPYSALVSGTGRFLAEDHELFYTPSLNFYRTQIMSFRRDRFGPARMLTIGDIDYLRYSDPTGNRLTDSVSSKLSTLGVPVAKLPALPGSKKEIEEISSLFNGRVDFFAGSKATAQELRVRYLTDYDFIHFAGHAFSPRNGEEIEPVLFLQPQGEESGILTNSALFELEVSPYLVALSACDTGIGASLALEGVDSLARTLLTMGSDHVVASFWQVDDEATRHLMRRFYAGVLQGLLPAAALQKAQLSLRNSKIRVRVSRGLDGSFASRIMTTQGNGEATSPEQSRSISARHPFFWASFGVFGVNRQTRFSNVPPEPFLGTEAVPIKAGGPSGQRAYLERLRCPDATQPTYHRLGNIGEGAYGNIVDRYAVTCPGKADQYLYMDYYFPGYRERRPPRGFELSSSRSNAQDRRHSKDIPQ